MHFHPFNDLYFDEVLMFTLFFYITGKDDADFARPVGVPKTSKRLASAGSTSGTGTLSRKPTGSKSSGRLT